MKLVKNMNRVVSFSNSTWGQTQADHNRNAEIARRLEDAGFARFVLRTDPYKLKFDEKGEFTNADSTEYYKCSNELLNQKQFDAIRKTGVSPIVHGIYEAETQGVLKMSAIAMAWLWCIAGLLKFAGVI